MMSAEAEAWEAAYLRFETPDQERRKFTRRLEKFGANDWPRGSSIVELFCGRGSGLVALEHLGFTSIEGIDLSATLLANYRGSAVCHVGDCRALPFEDESRDILVVQGGLHHLVELPGDLRATLREAHRVLRDGGRFVAVEPWLTPFLRLVHVATNNAALRRVSSKLDALAVMIDGERATYERWLDQPGAIRAAVSEVFATERESTRLGKWRYVGRKARDGRLSAGAGGLTT